MKRAPFISLSIVMYAIYPKDVWNQMVIAGEIPEEIPVVPVDIYEGIPEEVPTDDRMDKIYDPLSDGEIQVKFYTIL